MTRTTEFTLANLQKEQKALATEQMVLTIDMQITQIELQRDLEQMGLDHQREDAPTRESINANKLTIKRIRHMNETLSALRTQRIEVKFK